MAWADLFLLVALCAAALWLLVQTATLAKGVEAISRKLRRDAAFLLDLQESKAASDRRYTARQTTADVLTGSVSVLRDLHLGISRLPFAVLKGVSGVKTQVELVQQLHDIVSHLVYNSLTSVMEAAKEGDAAAEKKASRE